MKKMMIFLLVIINFQILNAQEDIKNEKIGNDTNNSTSLTIEETKQEEIDKDKKNRKMIIEKIDTNMEKLIRIKDCLIMYEDIHEANNCVKEIQTY